MSFFTDMDTKHKIILIGGGGIAAFFLIKSVTAKMSGTTSSVASPTPIVDSGTSAPTIQAQADMGTQIVGAVDAASQVLNTQNNAFQADITKSIADQNTAFKADMTKSMQDFQTVQAKQNTDLFQNIVTHDAALQAHADTLTTSLLDRMGKSQAVQLPVVQQAAFNPGPVANWTAAIVQGQASFKAANPTYVAAAPIPITQTYVPPADGSKGTATGVANVNSPEYANAVHAAFPWMNAPSVATPVAPAPAAPSVSNQRQYLNNLVSAGGGAGSWAKSQIAAGQF